MYCLWVLVSVSFFETPMLVFISFMYTCLVSQEFFKNFAACPYAQQTPCWQWVLLEMSLYQAPPCAGPESLLPWALLYVQKT